ncbi:Hypothetical protein NTJ_16005 [Nesidiocoris tenuis]|uniref:Uncharacterized protein n=1 Tax=Nesidiocoris tenuis TaxID=355587 RepID=A0ABN7BIA0_9HEMI|nr:Hypothetical protein NTJ_16005 [Nesidiocoris tenuis]
MRVFLKFENLEEEKPTVNRVAYDEPANGNNFLLSASLFKMRHLLSTLQGLSLELQNDRFGGESSEINASFQKPLGSCVTLEIMPGWRESAPLLEKTQNDFGTGAKNIIMLLVLVTMLDSTPLTVHFLVSVEE